MKHDHRIIISISIVFTLAGPVQADDCAIAQQLFTQAYQAGRQGAPADEQRALLQEALQLCPTYAEAHNNLGVLLEDERQFEQALSHYQEAARLKPDLQKAWFGIGEVYIKTNRQALALEAYLRTCADPDARLPIEEILASQRYRTVEEGEQLDQQSLELLFDPQRREAVNQRLTSCGFDFVLNRSTGARTRAYMESELILRNILFDLGKASLKEISWPQLQDIGAALQRFPGKKVFINGHTDKQWRSMISEAEKKRLNQQLSEARAAAVAGYLKTKGIQAHRMIVRGHGQTQPEDDADTREAYRKNRRVTITVE